MKKTFIASVLFLTFVLVSTNVSFAKVIFNSGKPDIMITSPEFVSSKRNTELKWTWTSIKNTPKVDLYLIDKNKKYTFAKGYPNTGNFWWATGYSNTEWKREIKNGEYKIAVCPSGNKKINLSCGIFDIEIYGDSPVLKIISPKGGAVFKQGSQIDISFSGAKVGEKYEFLLWYPAKVSPIEYNLGQIIADTKGKESFTGVIPTGIQKGVYTIGIIQKTNEGGCLNTCAQTESQPIRIR